MKDQRVHNACLDGCIILYLPVCAVFGNIKFSHGEETKEVCFDQHNLGFVSYNYIFVLFPLFYKTFVWSRDK